MSPDAAQADTPWLRPALNFSPELLLRAQAVKVFFIAPEGLLPDGRWPCAGDAYGFDLLKKSGLPSCVICPPGSGDAPAGLQKFEIEVLQAESGSRLSAAEAVLQRLNLSWSEAAVMGCDWPDLALMRRAALSCAPADAHAEARAIAHHVTQTHAGRGAAREVCDLLLVASGRYVELLQECVA